MKKNDGRLIFGGILVFLGLVFLFEQFGLLTFLGVSAWFVFSVAWSLVIIYFGYRIFKNSNSYWGIFLIAVGCISLLDRFLDVNFWNIIWPLGIITLGVFLLVRKNEGFEHGRIEKETSGLDEIHEDIVFWGIDRKITSKAFTGGEINCIFGGGKLDLSGAKMGKEGADLEVNCVFGGLEVIVPKSCKVISNGTGVFGGWDVKVKENSKSSQEIRITGSAVFGGVEIKK